MPNPTGRVGVGAVTVGSAGVDRVGECARAGEKALVGTASPSASASASALDERGVLLLLLLLLGRDGRGDERAAASTECETNSGDRALVALVRLVVGAGGGGKVKIAARECVRE